MKPGLPIPKVASTLYNHNIIGSRSVAVIRTFPADPATLNRSTSGTFPKEKPGRADSRGGRDRRRHGRARALSAHAAAGATRVWAVAVAIPTARPGSSLPPALTCLCFCVPVNYHQSFKTYYVRARGSRI